MKYKYRHGFNSAVKLNMARAIVVTINTGTVYNGGAWGVVGAKGYLASLRAIQKNRRLLYYRFSLKSHLSKGAVM